MGMVHNVVDGDSLRRQDEFVGDFLKLCIFSEIPKAVKEVKKYV